MDEWSVQILNIKAILTQMYYILDAMSQSCSDVMLQLLNRYLRHVSDVEQVVIATWDVM